MTMLKKLTFYSVSVLIGLASVFMAHAEEGVLFDGSDLSHWNTIGDANWKINGDVVEADMGSGMLVSKQSYGDFKLTLDFWVDEPANSGVFIRCSDAGNVTAGNAYEVNIFDTRPDQTYRTGGIVNVAAPSTKIDTGGKWNHYEIVAKGSQLIVTLNGVETVNVEDSKFSAGPFALQYGAGIVKFRNVRISAL